MPFKIQRRGRQQERQKTVDLISNKQLCTLFLCISLPVFARLRVLTSNDGILFLFLHLDMVPRNATPNLTKEVGRNNCGEDWKNANSLFQRRSPALPSRRLIFSSIYGGPRLD